MNKTCQRHRDACAQYVSAMFCDVFLTCYVSKKSDFAIALLKLASVCWFFCSFSSKFRINGPLYLKLVLVVIRLKFGILKSLDWGALVSFSCG